MNTRFHGIHRAALAALTLGLGLTGCTETEPATTDSASEGSTAASSTGPGTTTQVNPTTGTSVPTTGEPTTTTLGTGSATMDTTGTTADVTATDPGTTTGTTTDATSTGGTSTSTTGETSTGGTMGTTTGGVCPEGTIVCDGDNAQTCDGAGGFTDITPCPNGCIDGVGCGECVPGATQCADKVSQVCDDQGKWADDELCDDVQGISCDAQVGVCVGTCAKKLLGQSYIGCDYYPTTLSNLHETQPWNFHYAVVVANTTNDIADITITQGANPILVTTVGPNTAKVINLPYVFGLVKPSINEAGPSTVVTDGAYRLRSNQPVTVYQYEPIEYTLNGLFTFTNDASLLLPVNTWTGNYIVASRNHWPIQGFQLPGWYAVVASQDNTTVTVVPSATGKSVFAGGGIAGNGTGVVVLNEGDVLEVFSSTLGGIPDNSDLTGTIINADKPVEVFGGHKCTQVPVGTQACDRLEEAMLPIETLAKKYIVTPPLIPTGGNVPKAQMVRIIATEAATALTYDPMQPGAPAMIANAGDWVEIAVNVNDFEIQSDKKIMVAQYMQGQQAGGNSGDPAMALAVATEQYRTKYLVHAPIQYESNFVNITAPMDAMITLDGAPVVGFKAIGATGYGVARVKMGNNVDGNHDLLGDKAFGVSVYGYGQYTSYWYPGGLDLEVIPM
jgi:hypothetical protein